MATKYAGNTIVNWTIVEPKQTPITPNRRVRRIERDKLAKPETLATIACNFITPAPLSSIDAGMDTAVTTPQRPNATRSDVGTCNDLPITTRMSHGPVKTRRVHMGTASKTMS